uniref:Uncharacterized protein n=1 Tax=Ananas comosus var. bracteatus TaxID=296719 RepID=A0A6V7Q3R5_ANACO|nr:unnamed protein product [Ananas comosus var. bracteatus]
MHKTQEVHWNGIREGKSCKLHYWAEVALGTGLWLKRPIPSAEAGVAGATGPWWGTPLFPLICFSPSHTLSLSLSKRKEKKKRRERRKRRERGRRRPRRRRGSFLPSLFKLEQAWSLVLERVGEDGSSIRRAGAKISPNQALKGSNRPEEPKRRPRTAKSSFLASRHYQEVGVTIPKQLGSLLCLSSSVPGEREDRGKGIVP